MSLIIGIFDLSLLGMGNAKSPNISCVFVISDYNIFRKADFVTYRWGCVSGFLSIMVSKIRTRE